MFVPQIPNYLELMALHVYDTKYFAVITKNTMTLRLAEKE